MKPAVEAFKRKYSHIILEAIDWAMEPDQRLRPQNCTELLEMLKKVPEEEEPQSLFDKFNLNSLSNVLPWNK